MKAFFLSLITLLTVTAFSYRYSREETIVLKTFNVLNGLEKEFSMEHAVDEMYSIWKSLHKTTDNVPQLSEIFLSACNQVSSEGIEIDQTFKDQFHLLILEKEQTNLPISSIKQRRKHDGIQVPDGVAIGFCKALAGGLLCIIPTSATWAIGSGLFISGINDMINHAGDPINNNAEKRMRKQRRISNLSYSPALQRS